MVHTIIHFWLHGVRHVVCAHRDCTLVWRGSERSLVGTWLHQHPVSGRDMLED